MSAYQALKTDLVSEFNFISRRAQEIAATLLFNAMAQGRGAEMYEKIAERVERAHTMPEGHAEGVKLAMIYDERCGTSQTLRKMSLATGMIFEDASLGNPEMPKVTLH